MSQNLNHKIEKYSHYVSQNPGNQLFLYKLNKYKNQLNNNMNVHVGGVTKADIEAALNDIEIQETTATSVNYIGIIQKQHVYIEQLVNKITDLKNKLTSTRTISLNKEQQKLIDDAQKLVGLEPNPK